jgi:hypothetical protein
MPPVFGFGAGTLPATQDRRREASTLRLSGEDLTFWWADSPMQSTTMAMLLLLDRMPEWDRLRRAVGRAVAAVPLGGRGYMVQ